MRCAPAFSAALPSSFHRRARSTPRLFSARSPPRRAAAAHRASMKGEREWALASGDARAVLTTGDAGFLLAVERGGERVLQGVSLGGVSGVLRAHVSDGFVSVETECGGALCVRAAHGDAFDVRVSGGDAARALDARLPLRDLGEAFGIGHLMRQPWPLQDGALELGPVYPFDNGPNGVCTLALPTVVGARGVGVAADDASGALHVSLNASRAHVHAARPLKWGVGVANFDRMVLPRPAAERAGDGALVLQARAAYDWPHVRHPWLVDEGRGGVPPELRLLVVLGRDARDVTEHMVLGGLRRELPEGRPRPPMRLLEDPIWTTWAKYKDAVCAEDVVAFAREIVDRGLPRSVMEIDDRWSVKYGDLEFDKVKFPDPRALVDALHGMGFLVTVWVIPFANMDSDAVTDAATRGFFVKDASGDVGAFDWWQPTRVAALDVTNPAACEWFVSRLHRLQSLYNLDGFKFDAGEPCFLPPGAVTHTPLSTPADYTRAWIRGVAGRFDVSEVRAGVRGTEGCAPLLRLFDRFSTWGVENGLASVISATLTASVLGYPFVLPDMIGGNAYGDETPDAELMIRWAQASACLPALQFSIPPWDYGDECAELCARALDWRRELFWPAVRDLVEDAARNFQPIVRPMWWGARDRKDALAVADQLMLGDDLVVAPVVVQGARERRVFLPDGTWERVVLSGSTVGELAAGKPVLGPCWLESVPAPLHEMPTWRRVLGA